MKKAADHKGTAPNWKCIRTDRTPRDGQKLIINDITGRTLPMKRPYVSRMMIAALLFVLVTMRGGTLRSEPDDPAPPADKPMRIAIVGDIQRTSDYEEWLVAREQNDESRKKIVDGIATDKPDMLLLLGDQVSAGESESDWQLFDDLMKPLKDLSIRTVALVGNHDYGFTRRSPQYLRSFYSRFSDQPKEFPAVVTLEKGIVLVMLNSNFDMLSPDDYQRQGERYHALLKKLDDDPEVRGVIVASHHPPYSNSSLGNDQGVIDQFAKPFLQARKTRLYLAGHVHSYERFIVQDKMFVTSGGGGGPRRQCNVSPTRECKNDAYREGTLRPFHYVRLTITNDKLSAEVMMLRQRKGKKEKEFTVGDKFSVGIYGPPGVTAGKVEKAAEAGEVKTVR
jgi:3',5'-cyclic AMP phosphodiesterase CpdA